MSTHRHHRPRRPAPITGRMVLLYFVAFFGIIFAMNFYMVRVAISSFSGVETESAYKAGLSFKNDVAAAHAQDARHWTVEASLQRGDDAPASSSRPAMPRRARSVGPDPRGAARPSHRQAARHRRSNSSS